MNHIGRKQYVETDGKTSSLVGVLYGVPKGSILGPLLFLVDVNDMKQCISSFGELMLYANDSSSSLADVIYGVPQGSILGPFLFLVYMSMT